MELTSRCWSPSGKSIFRTGKIIRLFWGALCSIGLFQFALTDSGSLQNSALSSTGVHNTMTSSIAQFTSSGNTTSDVSTIVATGANTTTLLSTLLSTSPDKSTSTIAANSTSSQSPSVVVSTTVDTPDGTDNGTPSTMHPSPSTLLSTSSHVEASDSISTNPAINTPATAASSATISTPDANAASSASISTAMSTFADNATGTPSSLPGGSSTLLLTSSRVETDPHSAVSTDSRVSTPVQSPNVTVVASSSTFADKATGTPSSLRDESSTLLLTSSHVETSHRSAVSTDSRASTPAQSTHVTVSAASSSSSRNVTSTVLSPSPSPSSTQTSPSSSRITVPDCNLRMPTKVECDGKCCSKGGWNDVSKSRTISLACVNRTHRDASSNINANVGCDICHSLCQTCSSAVKTTTGLVISFSLVSTLLFSAL